jgi:hypothetical protein
MFKNAKGEGEMKFNVYAYGDHSVGIPDFNTEVEIKDCDLKDVEDSIENGREELRQSLKELFEHFFVDGKCRITFEDEGMKGVNK